MSANLGDVRRTSDMKASDKQCGTNDLTEFFKRSGNVSDDAVR